jgi:hypothetical protein
MIMLISPILQRLLCKRPEDQHEESFGETRVRPVVSRLALGVLFIDDPAVCPRYDVPEENPIGPEHDSLLDWVALVVEKCTYKLGCQQATEVAKEADQSASANAEVVGLEVA